MIGPGSASDGKLSGTRDIVALPMLRPTLLALFLLLALGATGAWASVDGPTEIGAGEPVRFRGRELFAIVGDIPPFSRSDRARAIERRLERLVDETPAGVAVTFASRDLGSYAQIVHGEQVVAVISEADGRPIGLSAGEVAKLWATAMEAGIGLQREADRARRYERPFLRAAVTLLLMGLSWWLLRRLNRFVEARLAGLEARSARRGEASDLVRSLIAAPFGGALRGVVRWIYAVLAVIVLVLGAQYLFSLHPATRAGAEWMMRHTLSPLRAVRDGLLSELPDLTFVVVLAMLVVGLDRVLRWLFQEVERGRVRFGGFEAEWARPTLALIRVGLFSLASIVAFPHLPGAGTTAFNGISIFLGLLVTVASGGVISNLASGFLLSFAGSFREGEVVRIGEHFGEIVQKRLITTSMMTHKGVLVSLPNAMVLAGSVQNLSRLASAGRVLVSTCVGIGYEVPWRQVESMLLSAAARTSGLAASSTAPFVLQLSLGDYAVTYELNVAVDDPLRIPTVLAELNRSIQDVFNENGVQIMTPSYVADPPEPKVVPKERWFVGPARE